MLNDELLNKCELCPRKCQVNRFERKGFCGEKDVVRIARAELHHWEEPCISSKNGSGAVFFSGCSLKCCYCQNCEISALNKGFEVTSEQLANIFLDLQDKGAHNINLVNPTHFIVQITNALDLCEDKLFIPVVYNCGGYENSEIISQLKGYVDIFLPDLKYYDSFTSQKYSSAKDYYFYASKAIKTMVEVVRKPVYDEKGLLKSGVMVRHLVLPNNRHDSIKLMQWLGETFAKDEILVSLMSQYTPVYKAENFSEINRRTSTFEYNSVCKVIENYGFDGYFQQRNSAGSRFIPKFYDSLYFEIKNRL